jgi:hypothetical protein
VLAAHAQIRDETSHRAGTLAAADRVPKGRTVMTNDFEAIDLFALDTVCGGVEPQPGTRTTESEAGVETPYGKANAKTSSSSSEPSEYLRCLDLVGRQAGMMESPNNVERRQQALCGPLLKKN